MVFEGYDQDRQGPVAIKTLTNVGPEAIYQFKQEFRSLADISHPNLVGLFELGGDSERCFFTMELVDGLPFSTWARNAGHRGLSLPDAGRTSDIEMKGRGGASLSEGPTQSISGEEPTMLSEDSSQESLREPGAVSALLDATGLRKALRQLVEGVSALHGAGKLHRDLKSSNVLVTPAGRVVILDFGLIQDLGSDEGLAKGFLHKLVGTPSHISPEQVAGKRATEASDWYAVGVMLYESLTGRLPFSGSPMAMLQAKQEMEPPAAGSVAPGIPEDLAALCMALLDRDPAARPTAAQILEKLGEVSSGESGAHAVRRPFVGREAELASLQAAFTSAQRGEPSSVLLHGSSGIGKSFLVRRFLRLVQEEHPRALALYGRCFEQESVPFKALDNLIDGLSQALRYMPSVETEPLLPRHIGALAILFPVLKQVPSIARAAARGVEPVDGKETRRRAFGALRALLSRLSDQRPLVVVLDDLQWGDLDSVALLAEVLRPPYPPAFLLVACYRREESETSPALLDLLPLLKTGRHLQLPIDPLDPETSAKLALSIMGPGEQSRAKTIAEEASGSPLFISELARYSKSMQETAQELPAAGASPLERVLLARVHTLPEKSRQVLEFLSVAGYPLPWAAVRKAAEVDLTGSDPFAPLRTGRLARIRGTSQHRTLEVYHDRVREVVAASLPAELTSRCHLRLAEVLEQSPGADPRGLAQHYLAGGERAKAAEYSGRAADLAAESLAFEQAASLYQQAIQLKEPGDPALPALRAKLARALVNAGRSSAAARVYLDAAAGGDSPSHRIWRRRAAEEFFRSGHLGIALATSREVLGSIGIRIPATPTGALVSLTLHRLRLQMRGLKFQEKAEEEIPLKILDRIDTLWSVAMGLGSFDMIRAADFQARQLILALDAGEPYRLVRGLAHEMALRASTGTKALAEVRQLQAATMALAERIGQPEPLARAYLGAGIASLTMGRWRSASEWTEKAETILRASCTGVAYEIHIAQHFWLTAQSVLGRISKASHRYPELLSEAQELGDILTMANLRIFSWNLHLAEDDPERAENELGRALEGWPETGFLTQHFQALTGRVSVKLYTGHPESALEELKGHWPSLRGSFLLRAQGVRVTCVDLRARCLLALAAARPERRFALLRAAQPDIQALLKESCGYAKAMGLKNLATALSLEGRHDDAQARFVEAEIAFEAAEMTTHVEAVRWARGAQLGSTTGEELMRAAESAMEVAGYKNPAGMVRMLVPARP